MSAQHLWNLVLAAHLACLRAVQVAPRSPRPFPNGLTGLLLSKLMNRAALVKTDEQSFSCRWLMNAVIRTRSRAYAGHLLMTLGV